MRTRSMHDACNEYLKAKAKEENVKKVSASDKSNNARGETSIGYYHWAVCEVIGRISI